VSAQDDQPSVLPSQAQVIGAVNDAAGETGVVVCAAGSAPGELHKLWRARDPAGKGYHVEYGYSCMGYEIPGGMGVKLAAPDREVFVVVGDGSYLMLPGELVTAVAERIGVVIVVIDNHGYASIGALSRSVGAAGYGTHYRFNLNGSLPVDEGAEGSWSDGGADALPVDLAANAASLGAKACRVSDISGLREALHDASGREGPVVIVIETDRYRGVPSYDAWWDVPVAEVSEEPAVEAARASYERDRLLQRHYVEPPRGE
jgi:3D-(3,5/4)-trihydroxycyclohexane-1,2-dione acylhydrolase (decyclizing)